MAIAEKLNYLIETKNQIKNAITGKGVSVTDTDSFRSYATKIGQIESGGSSTEDWQPELDWWDIETILENDTEEYTQKIICLLTNKLDDGATTNIVKGGEKYKLSDGQVIEQSASFDLDITTLFDTTQDKECSKGYKTRYIIYYSNASSMTITLPDNVIYTIFSGVKFGNTAFREKRYLEGIKFINNTQFTSNNMSNMFNQCHSLRQIPNLDTSNVTSMSYMFYQCYSLEKIPNLYTNNITSMTHMFYQCYALKQISNLNTSNVTNMYNMLADCYRLENVNIDTSKATNINSLFSGCRLLKEITNLEVSEIVNNTSLAFNNCNLLVNIRNINEISLTLNFTSSIFLNHTTLLKILNALVDLTGQTTQTLTLGSTNLAKLTDEEKAIATNKNWTLA